MSNYNDPRLSILNVAQKSKILILRQASKEEFAARCPFCGDSENPHHAHLMLNIVKDAYHCTRCGEKGFAIGLYAKLHGISNKQAFKELMNMAPETTPKIEIKQVLQSPVANINERDKTYRAFLDKLTLKGEHLQNLIRRGLSWEEIGRNLYKSVPQDEKERQRICKELIKEGHSLKGIPGFYKDDNWTFVDYKGFLIPVKDVQGRIQGLQVRLDFGSKRYLWFSSHDKPCGTRAYAWIGVSGVPSKTVIITEGALKADIAHYLSRFTFVSVPGVNSIRGIEQVLRDLDAKRVYIAFDMDMSEKVRKIVLEARKKLEKVLLQNGFDVRIKEWDRCLGKGIDDYLLTLKKLKKIV